MISPNDQEPEVLQGQHDKPDPSPLRNTGQCSQVPPKREPAAQPTESTDGAKYLKPLLGEWKHFTDPPPAPPMSNQGITVLNNFVYLIGGDNNVQGFRAKS